MRTSPREILALGVFGGGSRAGERIELLLRRGRKFSGRVSKARVAVSCAVMLGFVVAGSSTRPWIAFAQAPRLVFEAAAIKPSDPGHAGAQMFSPSPGRFTVMTATVKDLVGFAYRVEPHQISGLTAESGKYDIDAKSEQPATTDQFRLMLQTLLADRFHVRFHREMKELPVYNLVTGKNGPKLREVSSPGLGVGGRSGLLNGRGADLATLASTLSRQLDRSVLDRTGIVGFYEFTLKWTPVASQATDAPGPDLFTAVQEQLGLRLEPSKGPVEILVIDRAEKPDEN